MDVNPLVTPLQGGWSPELKPRAMKLGSDLEVQAAANREREAAAGGPRDKVPAAALHGLNTNGLCTDEPSTTWPAPSSRRSFGRSPFSAYQCGRRAPRCRRRAAQ